MMSNNDFLQFTEEKQKDGNWGEVQLQMSPSYQNVNFTVKMEGKTSFLLQREGCYYTLNIKSKMQPKYNTNNPGSQVLERIVIHNNNQEMHLLTKDNCFLVKIYNHLKCVLSHKGFNQYFRPLKRLGRGNFAAVYLVEHKITKEQFAAKVFSKEGQKIQHSGREALENEIRTIKVLSHPNVIRFEGIYETENLIYLVTQYLSGGTLEEFMRNKSSLMGDFITKIISDTLEALKYFEENKMMHRDMKPENIILRESDKKWVVADFGLAAFTNEAFLYDKCGTMGYIAPEILVENNKPQQYTSACDLYSLGVIAYQLIVGSLPFKVEKEGMFDCKVIWQAFTKPECTQLHPDIVELLRGLLENSPEKRLTPSQALSSALFTNKEVVQSWRVFNQKRINESYNKILKLRNRN